MLRRLAVSALALVVFLAFALLAACEKPQPPHVTPKEARVTAVTPRGIEVLVKVEATNPNSFPVTAQRFSGKAKLEGTHEFASVSVAKQVTLPPNTPTLIDVPLSIPWTDAPYLGTLLQHPHPVPYVVDGTVAIGGEKLNVDVPFTVSGTITVEQLATAAIRGLPGLFPPPATSAGR